MSDKLSKIIQRGITATAALALVAGLAACSPVQSKSDAANSAGSSTSQETTVAVSDGEFDFSYSNRDLDPSYDAASATKITLSGSSASVEGVGAEAADGSVKITQDGVYVLSGSFAGTVDIAAPEDAKVQVVLNGAEITGTENAITATTADKVFVTLADGSTNSLAATAVPSAEDVPNAALWADCDLTIQGSGALTVNGADDGIKVADDLAITGGTINVSAGDDAVVGHDSLKITSANITATAKGGDALKVSEGEKEGKGFVSIDGGVLKLASVEDDGISASRYVRVAGGEIDIDVADNGISSDDTISVENGTIAIRSNSDGIHAEYNVDIADGVVSIDKANEGIESQSVSISGGQVAIIAKDDGINASKAGDAPRSSNPMGDVSRECSIAITGGYVYVDASGDGLDSNGVIDLAGGTVVVNGPADNANCAIDAGVDAYANGALVIAIGSSGMFESFSSESSTPFIESDVSVKAGDTVSIVNDGQVIISMTSSKIASKLQVSVPGSSEGDNYQIVIGGGIQTDIYGVATSGTLTGGDETISVSAGFEGTGEGFKGGPGGGPGANSSGSTPPGRPGNKTT